MQEALVPSLRLLTWLGDSRLVVPLAAMAGLSWWRHHRGMAVAWWLALAATALAVAISKLAWFFDGLVARNPWFQGISGHAAMSALCWPVLMFAIANRTPGRLRIAAVAVGACIALVVGVTRVRLDLHSIHEVVAGWLLGGLACTWFIVRFRASLRLPPWHAAIAAGLALLLALGPLRSIDAEGLLRAFAAMLRG